MSSSEKEGYQLPVTSLWFLVSLSFATQVYEDNISLSFCELLLFFAYVIFHVYHGTVSFCTHLCDCVFFQATSYSILYLELDRILMQIVPIVESVVIFAIVLLISEALSRSTKRLTGIAFILGFSTSISLDS